MLYAFSATQKSFILPKFCIIRSFSTDINEQADDTPIKPSIGPRVGGHPVFDFSGIGYDNFFNPDKSTEETRKNARQATFMKNFFMEYGTVDGSYDDLMAVCTNNQEGKLWYELYKQNLSFYLETFQQYDGVGMDKAEIDAGRKAYAKTSEARSQAAKEQNIIFQEYQRQRKASIDKLLDRIKRESHFGIVPLVRSDHLTMAQAIQIRRLKEPAAREALEAKLVLELKRSIVAEIKKTGVYSGIEKIIL